MRVCPGCRKRFDAPDAFVCTEDGLPLLDVSDSFVDDDLKKPGRKQLQVLEAGTVVGEYRIEGVVAEGGMGAVYAAVHPVIRKRVAIKVLAQEFAEDAKTVSRFVLEARSVNEIGHHNIVDIFSIGELDDGRNYLVMELLDGLPLSDVLYNVRKLPVGEVLPVYEQLCDALDAAHKKGFIHRDLKPENVFILRRPPRPFVKVLDFGVAKLRSGPRDADHKTEVGTVLGTPEYMAPEQCRGEDIDARVDVYAMGVMLYEILTGRRPFTDPNPLRIMNKQIREQPIPPSKLTELPDGVERVVLRAMAKDREKRYGDVNALLAAMKEVIEPLPWRVGLEASRKRQQDVPTLPPETPLPAPIAHPPKPRSDVSVPGPVAITGDHDDTLESGDTLVASTGDAAEPVLVDAVVVVDRPMHEDMPPNLLTQRPQDVTGPMRRFDEGSGSIKAMDDDGDTIQTLARPRRSRRRTPLRSARDPTAKSPSLVTWPVVLGALVLLLVLATLLLKMTA